MHLFFCLRRYNINYVLLQICQLNPIQLNSTQFNLRTNNYSFKLLPLLLSAFSIYIFIKFYRSHTVFSRRKDTIIERLYLVSHPMVVRLHKMCIMRMTICVIRMLTRRKAILDVKRMIRQVKCRHGKVHTSWWSIVVNVLLSKRWVELSYAYAYILMKSSNEFILFYSVLSLRCCCLYYFLKLILTNSIYLFIY